MKRLSIIPLAVLAVAPFARVTAQEPPPVKVGDRVRVSHDCTYRGTQRRCQEDRGTLDAVKADSIVLSAEKDQSGMVILIASVTRLRVVRGQKSNWARGVLIGSAIGAAGGIATAAAFCQTGGISACSDTPAGVYGGAAAVGAAGGALIGVIIGALTKSDRWEEVPLDRLRVSFVPQRDGRFALGFSVAF